MDWRPPLVLFELWPAVLIGPKIAILVSQKRWFPILQRADDSDVKLCY